MKKLLLSSVLFVSTMTLSTVQASEKNYSLTLTNPNEPAQLEVELHNGSISVIGYEGKTVEITAITSPVKENDLSKKRKKIKQRIVQGLAKDKAKYGRSTEGLKPIKAASLHLEIEERDNDIEIVSETMNQHVALVIKVPNNSSVAAEVYLGGGISIENVSGSLELEAFQGEVVAKGVSGPVVAETATHDIVIEFNQFNDTTPTSLTSHTGNIDITLDESTKANVNVQTYQGEIFSGLASDFVATDRVEEKNNGNRQKIIVAGALQAKANGGGQDLSLTTYMGNLYIRNK